MAPISKMFFAALLVCLLGNFANCEDGISLYGAARVDANQLSTESLRETMSASRWQETLEERRQKWLEMLGLSPLPSRTPLKATVTGQLDRGDYVVEKIHFQCMPGAYVIGNLYRPAKIEGKLPAVLYLCGHTKGKVNKPYQANPRWFAQHGYVAFVLDPIQLGESQGFHHGTYHADRWDWPSRGYTPAGTEVWNAMRALDYLESREDVDADRMGVTGLSGGGVISWCLGAADERVKVVVPVCQSGSIGQVVTDRGTDGHCDCAFWINYYRWCWPDIGALIAPRALLIASGSEDVLWRPAGYRATADKIRLQYYQLKANENFDLVEDDTPHGYTPKLRQAIFTWFNKHLKGDPTPVTDDVTEFVEPESNLLVFAGKLPTNDKMTEIDQNLVQQAVLPDLESPEFRTREQWNRYQSKTIGRLKETTFRNTLEQGEPSLSELRSDGADSRGTYITMDFVNADRLSLAVRIAKPAGQSGPLPTLVYPLSSDAKHSFTGGGPSRVRVSGSIATAAVEVRNTGATSMGVGYLWTARRTYPLLGQTLPERQVSDIVDAASLLRSNSVGGDVAVYGKQNSAPVAIYAALLDSQVKEIVLEDPSTTHEDSKTPEFLGVLRIGDLPHNLALAFPRPITFVGSIPEQYKFVRDVYQQYGEAEKIRVIDSSRKWKPFQ